MAIITPEGYSFGPLLPGYALSGYNQLTSQGELLAGFSAFAEIDDKLMIWQSPYFINQNCPTTGPTRPTTGQVYPRGYS